jgi:type IV pilus assembly protein PilC
MPGSVIFSYTGRDTAGKSVKGTVDAQSPAQVATRLNAQGIAPVSIVEAPPAWRGPSRCPASRAGCA